MVRELGLKRRETVWSLSTVHTKKKIMFTSVREDRGQQANCVKLYAIRISLAATLAIVTKNLGTL